jgi:hypothetical protein
VNRISESVLKQSAWQTNLPRSMQKSQQRLKHREMLRPGEQSVNTLLGVWMKMKKDNNNNNCINHNFNNNNIMKKVIPTII